jgi:hypothetical protein
LSALCVKAENEKVQVKKLNESLQLENRELSKEILDQFEEIKGLKEEIEKIKKEGGMSTQ